MLSLFAGLSLGGTAASAATPIPIEALVLRDLGVIQGSGDGITQTYLNAKIQKLGVARLLLRLLGKEDEANKYPANSPSFQDAFLVSGNNINLMAFLRNNPEYGFVGNGINLDPRASIIPQMMYKIVLTTLGYDQKNAPGVPAGEGDFFYSETVAFANALGLNSINGVKDVTNYDMAKSLFEALTMPMKDAKDVNDTLIGRIVDVRGDEMVLDHNKVPIGTVRDNAVMHGLIDSGELYVSLSVSPQVVEVPFNATMADIQAAVSAL